MNKLLKIILNNLVLIGKNNYQNYLDKLSDIKDLDKMKITLKFQEKNKDNLIEANNSNEDEKSLKQYEK